MSVNLGTVARSDALRGRHPATRSLAQGAMTKTRPGQEQSAISGCFQVPSRATNNLTDTDVQVMIVTDMVDDGEPIDVVAEVSFLTASEGGRSGPIRGRYRPNHNFGSAEDQLTYIGQLEFAPGDDVAPGESRKVLIRFVSGPGLDSLLTAGREWRIQEGSTLVARGRVIERPSKVTEGRR